MLRRLLNLWPKPVLLFFGLLLAVGYIAHFGYGVSSDEPFLMKYGLDSFEYLFKGGPIPGQVDWIFHSPIVQLFLISAQKLQGSDLGTDVWFLRHWLNFLMFFAAVLMFYRIATRLSSDWVLPFLGCVMLAFSPRIFAHAFYNPKDIPAMCLFTASMLTLLRARERPTIARLLVHALVCALLVSLRSFGLITVALTLLCFLRPTNEGMKRSALFLLGFALFLIAVWPVLWTDPLNVIDAFTADTGRQGGTLYLGEMTTGTPWHYVLVWIFITTPVLYSLLFVLGNLGFLREAVQSPRSLLSIPDELLFFLWFWLPVIGLIVMRAGIFNEWRHLLFIYPGFILIALFGIQQIFQWVFSFSGAMQKRALWFVIAVGVVSVVSTSLWMIRNHPLQFAYFSIPASWAEGNFEKDYWGLSYKQGLEFVLKIDRSPQVNIYAAERIAIGSALTLPLADWHRVNFTDPEDATYILDAFITNDYKPRFPKEKEIHSVKAGGVTLLSVYRGPDTEGVYEAWEN